MSGWDFVGCGASERPFGVIMMRLTGSMRVLVLDAECETIADGAAKILTLHGHEARGVYTHDAAIAAAQELRPQVLITSFNNRGKNGCETAMEIIKLLPACHVIVWSGQAAVVEEVERCRQLGYAFDFLEKPVHPNELLAKLQSYAEGASDNC